MATSYLRNFFSGNTVFDLFNQTGANIVAMAELLVSVYHIPVFDDRINVFNQIDQLEETGDDLSHKIYLLLDKVPFPPLSRGDIYAMASAIDDVADYIEEATNRMNLYKLEEFIKPMEEISVQLLHACKELNELLHAMRKIKDVDVMLNACRQVKSFETVADKIYYQALGKLFDEEHDAINLLKKREILHSLECAINKCKSAADAIEAVVIKRL